MTIRGVNDAAPERRTLPRLESRWFEVICWDGRNSGSTNNTFSDEASAMFFARHNKQWLHARVVRTERVVTYER